MTVLPKPWYREPWPWLLMAAPAAAVVGGIVMVVLAVTSYDGLVADDYYKQGLGINRALARDERARALGLTASVQFNPDRTRVRVVLGNAPKGTTIKLALVHPTRPESDQSLVLRAVADGTYEGVLVPPRTSRMRLRIEDAEGRWRLAGTWSPGDDAVRLSP